MLRIGVVSILILISVACSNDYALEDQFCDCYRDYAVTVNEDFDALVQKTEKHYLDAGTLESTNGAFYYKNVELLALESVDFDIAHSLLNFDEIQSDISQLAQIRRNSNCNHLNTLANESSRILRLHSSSLVALEKGILLESIWEIHAKELTADDYNHIFFKADYFIADYAIFIADFSDMRLLPLQFDFPDSKPVSAEIRNVFSIIADSDDVLSVNGTVMDITDLYPAILNFYQANIEGEDIDPDMPLYTRVDKNLCQTNIIRLEKELALDSLDRLTKNELNKWEIKLDVIAYLANGSFMEMDKSALIKLKNSAGTSYGLYIEIQNIIKQVVNELRVAKCEELGCPNYFDLKWDEEKDQDYLKMLRILVPERIIESEIVR